MFSPDHIEPEPKCRFNSRRLPPDPPRLGGAAALEWRRNWRRFYAHRWQFSEDARYWLSVAHTIGSDLATVILGPQDAFKIDNLL